MKPGSERPLGIASWNVTNAPAGGGEMEPRSQTLATGLLVLAACSGNPTATMPDQGDSAAGSLTSPVEHTRNVEDQFMASGTDIGGGSQLARIPAMFRGTWARSVNDCAVRNHDRFTVTGDSVCFLEGGGTADTIRRDRDVLAIDYSVSAPADGELDRAVYLALAGDGAMQVRRDESEGLTYRRCPESETREGEASRADTSPLVLAWFRGLYASYRRACAEDYNYAPAFQNVTVAAHEVRFFETGGPVIDVNVEANGIAITLRETVGDGGYTRAIYLALNDGGSVRYRLEGNAPVKTYAGAGASKRLAGRMNG